MNARTDGHPKRNENASEADKANGNGNAMRLQANFPHSRYESVDGEKLVGCISASPRRKDIGRGKTHENDKGDPEVTDLLDKTLCRTIVPCRDDPVVSPPDIKDTTNCL